MKPGYKTKSFWALLVATLLAALMGSGAVEGGMLANAVATVAAAIGALGYASLRAFEKGKDGKPSYKTTEFWLSLAAVAVGALMAAGVLSDGSNASKVVGGAASLLSALGYVVRFQLPPKA